MFKTDWLHEEEAKKLGMHQNAEHPYITQYMKSSVGDNDASRFREGLHYLVAITAASKDLPNWHWYAMEHVDNLGRCDYTGCNDSFGYTSSDKTPEGYAKNFIKPKMQSDGLVSASPIFKTGEKYPSGEITSALSNVFTQLGIGQSDSKNPKEPSVNDKAWLSYRLKGTQTEFVTEDGIKTVVGNSVTEGGFVNSSSCLTCHAQASVNADGGVGAPSFGFASDLNLFSYQRSTNGETQPSWFYQPGTNTPTAVQTDFVWGILFANDLVKPSKK
ncbi:MAG: hypothetical protein MI743_20335 [Sneathiellales bacterium]|nr:hypothetical protein [Sneathiellales bacterium]